MNGKSWKTTLAGIVKLLLFAGAVGAEFAIGGTTGHVLALCALGGREIASTFGLAVSKDANVTGAGENATTVH